MQELLTCSYILSKPHHLVAYDYLYIKIINDRH